MSTRTEAIAAYLKELYREYDVQVDNDRLVSQIRLSAVEVQSEQIISLSDNYDVEELVLLVMEKASEDAEEDLQELLDEMHAVSEVKRRLRDRIARLKKHYEELEEAERGEHSHARDDERQSDNLDFDTFLYWLAVVAARQSDEQARALADQLTLTRQWIHRAQSDDSLRGDLDSLNELSDMESLRLQMVMDRRSKLIETLSNIVKKMAATNDAITQNLK